MNSVEQVNENANGVEQVNGNEKGNGVEQANGNENGLEWASEDASGVECGSGVQVVEPGTLLHPCSTAHIIPTVQYGTRSTHHHLIFGVRHFGCEHLPFIVSHSIFL